MNPLNTARRQTATHRSHALGLAVKVRSTTSTGTLQRTVYAVKRGDQQDVSPQHIIENEASLCRLVVVEAVVNALIAQHTNKHAGPKREKMPGGGLKPYKSHIGLRYCCIISMHSKTM